MAKPSKGGRLRIIRWLPLLLALGIVGTAVIRSRNAAPEPAGEEPPEVAPSFIDPAFLRPSPLELSAVPLAVAFDHPLGSAREGALSYNAQSFLTSRHLGDDLNGIGGWNSDLGDPVRAMAVGEVVFAGFAGEGWGNMVVVSHRLDPELARREGVPGEIIQSVYAHLAQVDVVAGTVALRGQQIGTVGTADGRYLAHLHFELRPVAGNAPGVGYADSALGRFNPARFLERNAPGDEAFLMPNPAMIDRAVPIEIRPLLENLEPDGPPG